jgi:hypothetical protein
VISLAGRRQLQLRPRTHSDVDLDLGIANPFGFIVGRRALVAYVATHLRAAGGGGHGGGMMYHARVAAVPRSVLRAMGHGLKWTTAHGDAPAREKGRAYQSERNWQLPGCLWRAGRRLTPDSRARTSRSRPLRVLARLGCCCVCRRLPLLLPPQVDRVVLLEVPWAWRGACACECALIGGCRCVQKRVCWQRCRQRGAGSGRKIPAHFLFTASLAFSTRS